jgi:hypothetical protein
MGQVVTTAKAAKMIYEGTFRHSVDLFIEHVNQTIGNHYSPEKTLMVSFHIVGDPKKQWKEEIVRAAIPKIEEAGWDVVWGSLAIHLREKSTN